MNLKLHYEVWQNGLVLGTIVLTLGILRLFDPFPALPFSTELCFIGAGISYFFSFFSFRKVNGIKKC